MKTLLLLFALLGYVVTQQLSEQDLEDLEEVLENNVLQRLSAPPTSQIEDTKGVKKKFWSERNEFETDHFTTCFRGLKGKMGRPPYIPSKEFFTYYTQHPFVLIDYERVKSTTKLEVGYCRKLIDDVYNLFSGPPVGALFEYSRAWTLAKVKAGLIHLKDEHDLYSVVSEIIQRMFGAVVAGTDVPGKENEVECRHGHKDWYCVFEKYFYLQEAHERWRKEIYSKLSLDEKCDRELRELEDTKTKLNTVKEAMEKALICIKTNVDHIVQVTNPAQAKDSVISEVIIFSICTELVAQQVLNINNMIGAGSKYARENVAPASDNEMLDTLSGLAKSLVKNTEEIATEKTNEKIFDQIHRQQNKKYRKYKEKYKEKKRR